MVFFFSSATTREAFKTLGKEFGAYFGMLGGLSAIYYNQVKHPQNARVYSLMEGLRNNANLPQKTKDEITYLIHGAGKP